MWERLTRAEFDVDGVKISLNIQVILTELPNILVLMFDIRIPQDTGGSYVDDFPAMVELSLKSADAVLLGKSDVWQSRRCYSLLIPLHIT